MSLDIFSQQDNVFVSDLEIVGAKLENFSATNTQFVLDFDNTVTSYGSASTWQSIRNSGIMPDEYNRKMSALYEKYWPIEKDENKSFEERFDAMEQWHNQIFDFFYQYGLKEEDFTHIWEQASFRSGFNALFASEIPALILSAGVSNVIEKYLLSIGVDLKTIQIISNHLIFNTSWEYDGYSGDIIHAMNKIDVRKNMILSDIFNQRKNKILMWDRVADLKMIEESELSDALTIWFLNTDSLEHINVFRSKFDIVIQDDTSDKWVIKNILQELS